ncbi:zinc finger protein 185 isoform X2 [Notothenia coriiceps]|uniref:Zinc finger protein 185 isoform X2 n=1 Tax=Notothenia coriiceps TaxID=8208 RepID=A0A6I9NF04_9TELE|nr:PREDICTED: zinc finger protein 185 isoform X2 [Notothenia coriiceps]
MSKVDKESVFQTTKVRTKLKGDGSWMQRRNEAQAEDDKAKPWLAEVRASRENGAPVETSPVSSPTTPTPPPTKPDAERAPSSGYLMRGIFTKLDKTPSSSTTNGVSGTTTTQFTKKPSESYKKIAPYTVRPTLESQEDQLSTEEQEKRTEAASSVVRQSAARQRSYVLSAAKKFEVQLTDDDESAVSPAPASTPAPSPVAPATSVAPAPEIKPWKLRGTSVKTAVDVAVNEPVAPKVEDAAPEPVKDDPPLVIVKGPFEGMKPGCTKVDTPLPILLPHLVQTVCAEPEPEKTDVSGKVNIPLVKLTPASPIQISPASAPPSPAYTVPVSAATEIKVKTEPEPEPRHRTPPALKPRSSVDKLTALYDTLISFDTSSTSSKDDERVLAEKEQGPGDSPTAEDGDDKEPAPELSNCIHMTDDLLVLTNGPEESAEPVPPSPGRWSQDLLSGLDSESNPEKTSGSLDLLADDVIPINTVERSLSMQREEEKQTDETPKVTQSSTTETVTVTTKTVIISDKSQEDSANPWSSHSTTTVTESSSADPFDPYPIGTTFSNSSSDLLQPLSDFSINSVSFTSMENKDPSPETSQEENADPWSSSTTVTNSSVLHSPIENNDQSPKTNNALESLAENVIPISTDSTSLSSHRSWARTWETNTPQQANTEESQEAVPGGQTVDQETLVKFERKSKENDSPWDRWTSPTIYTTTTERDDDEEEEEEEEEEEGDESHTQTETVTTTITTIRETHSEQETVMDRCETYSKTVMEEDLRVQTPEPEAKKGIVYVKEYVNATEMSMHNARDNTDTGSDYYTSSSTSYSYSSPPSGSLSSACTFCGEVVGSDGKITIDHLNINCHPHCFKCGVCNKYMGDLLDSMFLHGGKVHCEACYSKALD